MTFCIQFWEDDNFGGWAIIRLYLVTQFEEDCEPDCDSIVEKSCWIAPYHKNHQRPPMKGWVSSDPLARGTPTVKYILNGSIEKGENLGFKAK